MTRSHRPTRPHRLAVCALACLPACTAWHSAEEVLVTSEPLGAHIYVDGHDTGSTTPAQVRVGGNFGSDHIVTLTKDGYRQAQRRLYQTTEGYTSKWIDGAFEAAMPPLPLFWTTGDLLLPFGIRGALLPGQLHVRLERTDAPLLGFDLLAARAAAAAGQPVDGATAAEPVRSNQP